MNSAATGGQTGRARRILRGVREVSLAHSVTLGVLSRTIPSQGGRAVCKEEGGVSPDVGSLGDGGARRRTEGLLVLSFPEVECDCSAAVRGAGLRGLCALAARWVCHGRGSRVCEMRGRARWLAWPGCVGCGLLVGREVTQTSSEQDAGRRKEVEGGGEEKEGSESGAWDGPRRNAALPTLHYLTRTVEYS